ncbi:MFS transporter [Maribacter aestuarii]|uniref:MFS transporter n=1 Tax=Maribacter aestuarii TaxID=1130723 RepID=UPI0025A5503B|nr:MFS transporter [Maribacter aestuarii]
MSKETSSPYKNTFFLLFVIATFISNTGTWLFTVGSGWLMTELDSSAFMVSLVQTATLIPLFILALPTGAIGDLYNQKKIIIISQSLLVLNTLIFAYIVYLEKATVFLLLFFTLLNGIGAAFSRPVLAALTPQLVPKSQLRTAVNLTGIAYNLSRALGPILGGTLVTMYALDLPFWIDALSFGAVVLVISFWKRRTKNEKLPDQKLMHSMGDSIRFLRYTPALYHSIIRALLFFFPAAALWAFMPLIAKQQFSGGADLYGYLLGASGIGAVSSVSFSNFITRKLGAGRLTMVVSILLGVSLFFLGLTTSKYYAIGICFLAGVCWQLSFTSIMTSAQYALPKWYGARGIAYFLMAMSGSMGIGSALWGLFADQTSLQNGLYAAGIASAIIALIGQRFPLDLAKDFNFKKASEVSVPSVSEKKDNGGWVMVHINYTINHEIKTEAIERISALKNKRYRGGARNWRLFSPEENKNQLIETYYEPSLNQLIRHQKQVTVYDKESEEELSKWITNKGGHIERLFFHEV